MNQHASLRPKKPLAALKNLMTDLLGTLRQAGSVPLAFRDDPDWYAQFQTVLLRFLSEWGTDPDQILGAGVSFPGIIDSREVIRSHILGLTHMGLERFRKALPVLQGTPHQDGKLILVRSA